MAKSTYVIVCLSIVLASDLNRSKLVLQTNNSVTQSENAILENNAVEFME